MLFIKLNSKDSGSYIEHRLLSYLKAKRAIGPPALNPSFEKVLKDLFNEFHSNESSSLFCTCSPLRPQMTLKEHKTKGLIISHKPGEQLYHRSACSLFDESSIKADKAPLKINFRRLADAIIYAAGLNVAFKPRPNDPYIYNNWDNIKTKIQKELPFLSKALFFGKKEYRNAVNTPFSVWIDALADKNPPKSTLVPYGSFYARGPYLCITVRNDNKEVLRAAFPIASFSIPIVVFNDTERKIILSLAKAIGEGDRIHSSYESFLLGATINTPFLRQKGSKDKLHFIAGSNGASLSEYVESNSPNTKVHLLQNEEDIRNLSKAHISELVSGNKEGG